ncbi:MAG: hypothetical protein ABFC84_17975 [Veillonellales bacterium]
MAVMKEKIYFSMMKTGFAFLEFINLLISQIASITGLNEDKINKMLQG